MTAHADFAHLAPVPGARPSAKVESICTDTYTKAMAGALSAGLDWPRKLRHAQVLSTSPDPRHRRLAEHIRDASELAAAGLLKPAVLDLTPDMRVRGKVTIVQPAYSPQPRMIRTLLADSIFVAVAAVVIVVMLGGPM